jgi:hypothetical protein
MGAFAEVVPATRVVPAVPRLVRHFWMVSKSCFLGRQKGLVVLGVWCHRVVLMAISFGGVEQECRRFCGKQQTISLASVAGWLGFNS